MEWISIKEKLPEVDKSVLVWNGHVNKTCLFGGEWLFPSKRESDLVTHWMPLPEPPLTTK